MMANAIISNLEEKIAGKNPAVIYLNKYHPVTFIIRREIKRYYGHKNVKEKINLDYPSYYTIKIKKQ